MTDFGFGDDGLEPLLLEWLDWVRATGDPARIARAQWALQSCRARSDEPELRPLVGSLAEAVRAGDPDAVASAEERLLGYLGRSGDMEESERKVRGLFES